MGHVLVALLPKQNPEQEFMYKSFIRDVLPGEIVKE